MSRISDTISLDSPPQTFSEDENSYEKEIALQSDVSQFISTYGESTSLYRLLKRRIDTLGPVFLHRTLSYISCAKGTTRRSSRNPPRRIDEIVNSLLEDVEAKTQTNDETFRGSFASMSTSTVNESTSPTINGIDSTASNDSELVEKIPYKEIVPSNVHIHFFYGEHNALRQTQMQENLYCPWCDVDCRDSNGLMLHLVCNHDRFSFSCSVHNNKLDIYVTNRDEWITDIRNRRMRLKQLRKNVKEARSKNANRTLVVKRRKKSNSFGYVGVAVEDYDKGLTKALNELRSIDDFFINCNPLTATAEYEEYFFRKRLRLSRDHPMTENYEGVPNTTSIQNETGPVPNISRQFFHSATFAPMEYNPFDSGSDSDEEVDSSWQEKNNEQLLDEIRDLNTGEKALMNLWNNFIFTLKGEDHKKESKFCDVCKTFIRLNCENIMRKNLRRNLMLHLTCLLDYGLLDTEDMKTLIDFFNSRERDVLLMRESI